MEGILHRLQETSLVSTAFQARHLPVMFFIHQVVPGTEGHQVSIVCWRRYGHGARAAHVGVTQLVCQDLQLVRRESIVIPKHVVVRRTACPLEEVRGPGRITMRPFPGTTTVINYSC